ncbi:MAG: hypothetical protein AAB628_01570 [Patescibacteria group bacterium]
MTKSSALTKASPASALNQASPVLEHTRSFILKLEDLPREEGGISLDLAELKSCSVLLQHLDADYEMYIRKECSGETHTYFLTRKNGQGISRYRYEVNITEEQFDDLWSDSGYYSINRYANLCLCGAVIEINTLIGEIGAGYLLITAKFDSFVGAQSFDPPEWFGWETTNYY